MNVKFTKEECDKIINLSKSYKEKHVSEIAVYDNLNYFYYSIIRDSNTQWIFDRFRDFLLDKFPSNKLNEMEIVNLHKYLPGCEFLKHNDRLRNSSHIYVVGSVISSNFKGGDFVLFDPEEVLTREPGYIYGFDTTRDHEVTKVTEGERWALVMFLTEKDLNIKPILF